MRPLPRAGILRPQDEDAGRVLDLAGAVAPRLVDQRDAAVGGHRRIDFAAGDGDDAFVGTGLAERSAIGQRFDDLDLEGEKH
jgi:hypothetical protein